MTFVIDKNVEVANCLKDFPGAIEENHVRSKHGRSPDGLSVVTTTSRHWVFASFKSFLETDCPITFRVSMWLLLTAGY